MVRGKLFLLAAPVVLAAAAWIGTSHNVAFALTEPSPQCSIQETGGAAPTTNVGSTNTFTFQVKDLHGNPASGQTVLFTESGSAAGSVSPTSGTTDGSGDVSTVFTPSSTDASGQVATITANDPVLGCAAGASTTISQPQGITTSGGGVGSGGTVLPNTSTGAPGPNGVLYLGLGLALMVILGGAVTLRRSRAAAS